MNLDSIIIEVDRSYSHVFFDCLHLWDIIFLVSIEYFRLFHLGSLS
jgi:hypothetical protein